MPNSKLELAVATAMRERYAEFIGDTHLVAFSDSKAKAAWLVCARTAIEVVLKNDTTPSAAIR